MAEAEGKSKGLIPGPVDPLVDQRSMSREDGKKEKDVSISLESIIYGNGELKILNQLKIPLQQVYESIETVEEGWAAIRLMKVCAAIVCPSSGLCLVVSVVVLNFLINFDKKRTFANSLLSACHMNVCEEYAPTCATHSLSKCNSTTHLLCALCCQSRLALLIPSLNVVWYVWASDTVA